MPAEANARLIAAAPELLAACKDAVRYLGEAHESTLANLRTAIAKATGKG